MQSPVDQEGKKTFLFRVTIMQLGITIQVNLQGFKIIKTDFILKFKGMEIKMKQLLKNLIYLNPLKKKSQ